MNLLNAIVLRPATPAYDEGLAFARYLDIAAEGFFELMLGRRSKEIIATAYAHPHNDFSYQYVTFAQREEVIIGMASGYTAEQQRRFSDKPLRDAVGYGAMRMKSVSVIFGSMLRFLTTHVEGDFYLQAVAVDDAARGQGVGTALMDAMEDCARANGATQFCLDASQSNGGARRLYHRRGMHVASKWPKLFFMPRIIVRMTKTL